MYFWKYLASTHNTPKDHVYDSTNISNHQFMYKFIGLSASDALYLSVMYPEDIKQSFALVLMNKYAYTLWN